MGAVSDDRPKIGTFLLRRYPNLGRRSVPDLKAYSLGLRQRVRSAALRGDRTIPEVAELFGVSLTFVNKMLRLHRSGSDLAPRPHGGATPRASARATTSCCAPQSPLTTTPRSASCANTWPGGRAQRSARRPSRGR